MNRGRWFTIIIGLQVLALFGMLAVRQYPLLAGERITLKVMPVDPRSLMSGDYVVLNYEISRPDLPVTKRGAGMARAGEFYARVRKGPDGVYRAAGYSLEKPETMPGEAVIKGTAGYSGARYGIETFFVEEGAGRGIESGARAGKVYAVVAVTSGGTAALDHLVVDGRVVE